MLRKRYRPLDAAEERSVGVEQVLQVGLLPDEQSYCFSWPDAPLTSTLRRSNVSLFPGMQSSTTSSSHSTVVQPPICTISSVATEHGMSDLFASFSKSTPAISFSIKGSSIPNQTPSSQLHKRHPGALPASSTEDSIFSFSATQLTQLKVAGAFDTFSKAYRQTASHSVKTAANDDDGLVCIAKRRLEGEILRLEWRAFRESEKTSPALQRILSLTTAVPFTDNGKKNGNGDAAPDNDTWQRIVYDMWVKWRRERVHGDANASPWGSSLLPGCFLPSLATEYFLRGDVGRNSIFQGSRSHEKHAGDGDDNQVPSPASSRRRGAYGFLRWRIDLYEPRLRAAYQSVRGEPGEGTSTKLLSATEVEKLVAEKLPIELIDVRLDERVDPIDALALVDIRSEVQTWRQWLVHV